MTLSDATPRGWPTASRNTAHALAESMLTGTESSTDFAIGVETSPVEAMHRADALLTMFLPHLLTEAPRPEETCSRVQSVLVNLVGRGTYDGGHVTVSVGDMNRPLPALEEEPGLYLVHRLAADMGQYAGDHGGRVTWAAVAA